MKAVRTQTAEAHLAAAQALLRAATAEQPPEELSDTLNDGTLDNEATEPEFPAADDAADDALGALNAGND